MQELVTVLAKALVEKPDEVQVEAVEEEDRTVLKLHVATSLTHSVYLGLLDVKVLVQDRKSGFSILPFLDFSFFALNFF